MSAGGGTGRARPPRGGERLDVEIESLAFGGRGVARVGGFVLFVEGGLPGERVTARVGRVRRGHAEASAVAIARSSPARAAPPCRHYAACGGCDLQHLAPAAQAEAKGRQVAELLARIGGVALPEVAPTLASPAASGYRSRMDFDFGAGPDGAAVLGLHRRGAPAEIVPIEACHVLDEKGDAVRNFIAAQVRARRLMPWDARRRRGLLRRAVVRLAHGTGEILVTLVTGRGDPPALAELARDLMRRHPRVVGVVREEIGRDDSPCAWSILAGRDHLFEEVDGDRLRLPAGAFFQPNGPALSLLRRVVGAALAPSRGEAILELYAGVGTFTLLAARGAGEVSAVEGDREAVAAGRDNSARAGLGHVRWICADVAAALPGLLGEREWDAILLDPPRTGLPPEVARALAAARARRMVYVSCDPATLARDVRRLAAEGAWRVASVQPIDLFPHTHHIECVVRLDRS